MKNLLIGRFFSMRKKCLLLTTFLTFKSPIQKEKVDTKVGHELILKVLIIVLGDKITKVVFLRPGHKLTVVNQMTRCHIAPWLFGQIKAEGEGGWGGR